jgi:hypothetical protein
MMPKPFKAATNPLTAEEAGELAFGIADRLDDLQGDRAEVAALLLLCTAFAYEPDPTTREEMHTAIEHRIGRMFPGFRDMVRGDMQRQLDALRKGATKGKG